MSRLVRTALAPRPSAVLPRPVVVRAIRPEAEDACIARLVELLARGLERLLTGKDEREGREEESGRGLDLLGDPSVTTQDRRRQSVEGQR